MSPRPTYCPTFEPLEDRRVLADAVTYSWTGDGDPRFDDKWNWVGPGGGHAVPTLPDTAMIDKDAFMRIGRVETIDQFYSRKGVVTVELAADSGGVALLTGATAGLSSSEGQRSDLGRCNRAGPFVPGESYRSDRLTGRSRHCRTSRQWHRP
jgi:hypothetical protein